jgi:hypothetical protein
MTQTKRERQSLDVLLLHQTSVPLVPSRRDAGGDPFLEPQWQADTHLSSDSISIISKSFTSTV